ADALLAQWVRAELRAIGQRCAVGRDSTGQRLIEVLGDDLRYPLQSIAMAAAILKPADRRDSELRDHIQFATGRMGRMIGHILEMSRLEAGAAIIVERRETDVSALMQSLLAEAELTFPGIRIERQLASG